MKSRFAAAAVVALVAALFVTSADPLPTGGTRSARGPPSGGRSADVLGEYEARLLTMLGLKERPRAASKSNLRAPAVMEHLYRAHLAADQQGRDGDSNRGRADDRWRRGVPVASDELRRASNTIRALHHIGECESIGRGFHSADDKNGRSPNTLQLLQNPTTTT